VRSFSFSQCGRVHPSVSRLFLPHKACRGEDKVITLMTNEGNGNVGIRFKIQGSVREFFSRSVITYKFLTVVTSSVLRQGNFICDPRISWLQSKEFDRRLWSCLKALI
jgi:hypothetical protein